MSDERRDEMRTRIESLCDEYFDAMVRDDGDETLTMPVTGHWVLLMTYDDAQDPTLLASNRLSRKNQATHETVGLLWLHLQELSHPDHE